MGHFTVKIVVRRLVYNTSTVVMYVPIPYVINVLLMSGVYPVTARTYIWLGRKDVSFYDFIFII